MATEQNSLGLFLGEGKENNLQNEMEMIRENVEKIREKHSETKPDLKYRGRLSGFVMVPDEVTYAGENLSHAEFRLWILLRKHCREEDGIRHKAWPGRERLAEMMGIKSLYRISNLIKSLEEKGLLDVERLYLGRPNHYTVKDPPRRWLREMKIRLKIIAEEKK